MEIFLRAAVGNAVLATLLALIAAGLGWILGRRPALRHALWVLVLLKLVTPPLSLVPMRWVPLPAPGDAPMPTKPLDVVVMDELDASMSADIATEAELEPIEPSPALATAPPWTRIAALVWLAGTGMIVVATAVRVGRWNRLLVLVQPAPDAMQARLRDLAGRMGLRRCPRLDWFHGNAAPMLWGLGRQARVIVPIELWNGLSEAQRTMLLIHELAHFRRRDHWVRLLELLATAVYWWLPVVWIARRALHEAEEQCCDAWVVSVCPKDTRSYAETLLQTVDFLSESAPGLPLAASGFGHVHHLKRRVIMIMRGTTPRSLNLPGTLGVLGLAAMLLPLSPTWAQKPDDDSPAGKPAVAPAADQPKEAASADVLKLDDVKVIHLRAAVQDLKPAGDEDDLGIKEPKRSALDGLSGQLRELGDEYEADAARADGKKQADTARRAAELARARAEVERARRQLQAAEKRLAAIEESRRNTRSKSADSAPESPSASRATYRVVRPKKPSASISKPTIAKELFRRSPADESPANDRRIAEIEAALQKLLDEVKSLKGEPEKPR